MRFLTKAFVLAAAATALFSSLADAFSTESIRSHASTIHSHIQSNHNALVEGIRSIQFHAQGVSDCFNANSSPTESNVKACFDIKGAPLYTDHCAADLLGGNCKLDIAKAMGIWAAQGPDGGHDDVVKCSIAMKQFSLDIDAKCSVISKGLSTPSSSTDSNPLVLLYDQCAPLSSNAFSDCKAAISSIANVQSACPTYNLGQIKANVKTIFQILDGPMSALCVKDDADPSKSCLSSVLPYHVKNFDLGTVTDAILNQMCKPCLQTIVNKIAALGGNLGSYQSSLQTSFDFFQTVCLKDPTDPSKYCANTIVSLMKTENNKGKLPDPVAVCSPCLTALKSNSKSMALLSDNQREQFDYAFYHYCAKNNDGGFCVNNLRSSVGLSALTPLINACSGTNNQCTDTCKTALINLYTTQCCSIELHISRLARILADVPEAQSALSAINTASNCVVNMAFKACEPPTVDIPISFSLPNIDAKKTADSTTIRAALTAALQSDLSSVLAIDSRDIVIGKIEADPTTKGGVKISFTIKVDAAFQSGYASTFNQKLQNGGLPLTNTAKAAETNQAKVDDSAPLMAAGEGAPTSAAVNRSGSIVAVVTMAIVATFAARF